MTSYFCPDCGELLTIYGRCWVCNYCGAEACGLGSVITAKKISCNGENLPGEIKSGVIAEVKKG